MDGGETVRGVAAKLLEQFLCAPRVLSGGLQVSLPLLGLSKTTHWPPSSQGAPGGGHRSAASKIVTGRWDPAGPQGISGKVYSRSETVMMPISR